MTKGSVCVWVALAAALPGLAAAKPKLLASCIDDQRTGDSVPRGGGKIGSASSVMTYVTVSSIEDNATKKITRLEFTAAKLQAGINGGRPTLVRLSGFLNVRSAVVFRPHPIGVTAAGRGSLKFEKGNAQDNLDLALSLANKAVFITVKGEEPMTASGCDVSYPQVSHLLQGWK